MNWDLAETIENNINIFQPSTQQILKENNYEIICMSEKYDESETNILNSCNELIDVCYNSKEIVEQPCECYDDIVLENERLRERIEILEKALADNNEAVNEHLKVLSSNMIKMSNIKNAVYECGLVIDNLINDEFFKSKPEKVVTVNNNQEILDNISSMARDLRMIKNSI